MFNLTPRAVFIRKEMNVFIKMKVEAEWWKKLMMKGKHEIGK